MTEARKVAHEAIEEIAALFAIQGGMTASEEVQSGLINSTFLVTFLQENGDEARYIMQRINEAVFKDPYVVMANVELVTKHINQKVLRVKKDSAGQTLNIYPGRDGRSFVEGAGGGVWRCYNFISGCRTYDVVENRRQAQQAARAFGAFQHLVSDLPADKIKETIPDFHHTRKRYEKLLLAITNDSADRVSQVKAEIDFIKKRESWLGCLIDLQNRGELPVRVTHNDTKINNVMIDTQTDEAVCVIDLDTVMPGLALYDFGDLVRTATSPAAEDECDLSKVQMRMEMFESLVEGYLESAADFLTETEVAHLVFAGKLISIEVAIRFLTDFLSGDVYFKTTRPGQNLDRCRTQLKLVESIEEQEEAMEDFVRLTMKNHRE